MKQRASTRIGKFGLWLLPPRHAVVRLVTSYYRSTTSKQLEELLALLNFIFPEILVDCADPEIFLHKDDDDEVADEGRSRKVVEAVHGILQPFLLRRVKADVKKSLALSEFSSLSIATSLTRVVFKRRNRQLPWADRDATEMVSLHSGEGY